ncbi:hypothetical protein O181_080106 [Austropuccinia psidii MF-1]|uniref:Integrase catalytic domain-containing protein n=1 Tax=Austropuccinia psidii MF-1 TaxID=1389203 RepID=A0A9Q3FHK5_9BASI|nr:hypothetical protein [Austropuccinia psidii MF-1]
MSNPIQSTGDHNSSDDEGYRTKIIILTRENWVQWSCQLENFLAGKGHESLLSPPTDTDKVSLKFKKRNSSALALLWTCVAPELHGILLAHRGSFYDSWIALGKSCGKNSIVIMCETLFKLMSIQYEPGTSLEKHIDSFQKTYASYESLTQGSEDTMVISTTIAAAFFIRSLSQDRDLSGLIQTLYDIKPFDLNSVLNRVAVEHCRRGMPQDQALLLDKQNPNDQSKPPNRTGNRGKGKAPTRGRNKTKANSNQKKEEDSLKRLEKLEKIVAKFELSAKNPDINVVAEHSKEPSENVQQSDSDAYVLEDEVLSIGSGEYDKIYLDSGAGRSVVNSLGYLTQIVKVNKKINTYAEPVDISHQGTLVFRGIHISPVYYAPKGKVNLLSVSQLMDHGLKPMFKGGSFLIMKHKSIIATFSRLGNLFAARIDRQSVFSIDYSPLFKDWHTILGHPSDMYIKKLIDDKILTGAFTSSNECQVCLHAKIKKSPHSRHLPVTHSPFEKLHVDTLEISPPSRQGFRYILVIVDDFTRFNRIFLMTQKSKAEGYISSFINEIKNKLDITPGYIHTDRGGEFDSNTFRQLLLTKGISLERGPPHSPQTNGVAEHFNQNLLVKIRCLLAQSNIPISYWDEAALHASLLQNLLPHRYLQYRSPNDVLSECQATIQPIYDLRKLVPFGIKVVARNENPTSKVNVTGRAMRALTFEPFSDALRVFDPSTGKVRITRDYAQLKSETSVSLRKDPLSLPLMANQLLPRVATLPVLKDQTSGIDVPNSDQQVINESLPQAEDHSPSSQLPVTTRKPRYDYVPHYDTAPHNISSDLNVQNILNGEKRQRCPPDRLMLADVITYNQALSNPNEEKAWQAAMKQEYDSLMNHNTGDLVPYPTNGSKVIGGMWRLTRKRNEFGEVYRFKARWVVLGNHQEHMLHYYDTWASVGRNETFKLMLILVVNQEYIPYQFDIETAFLHGEMDAVVYVKQVKGFEVPGKEGWVWRLNKSLYGTKQAPRMWQLKLVQVLRDLGMTSTRADDSLYSNTEKTMFLHVHVDDGFLIGKSEKEILCFLKLLYAKLKLKYQRNPTQHLGYHLMWLPDGSVQLSQRDLIVRLLKDTDMENSRSVKSPCNLNLIRELETVDEPINVTAFQQAIGSLNYLAQHTRPDILFTVNSLSRYATHPTDKHWVALKHLLRYLKGSLDLCLHYFNNNDEEGLVGWADADYANDRSDRKSISGNIVTYHGNPVSWTSKKQSVVAQSTTEAEFISMNLCAKQLRWMTYLLADLGQETTKPTVCNDNSGAVTISNQASLNHNTKHIEIRYQYVRDMVVKKLIKLKQVGTADMIADVLTKPMGIKKTQDVFRQLHLKNQGGVLRCKE